MGRFQRGTGLHVDTNGYSPYVEENGFPAVGPGLPLEKWFPLQAFVALSDHHPTLEDGGLEVVPGFHLVCQKYFQQRYRPTEGDEEGLISGRNLRKWGKYITKFPTENCNIGEFVSKATRIPKGWSLDAVPELSREEIQGLENHDDIVAYLGKIYKELEEFGPREEVRKGDYVLFDNLLPHQSSGSNQTESIRRVMYLTYLPDLECNHSWIDKQHRWRAEKVHPSDFEEGWRKLESKEEFAELSSFGKKVWRYEDFERGDRAQEERWNEIIGRFPLEQKYIDFYKRYGYVVIPGVVSEEEVNELNAGVDRFLEKKAQISVANLADTLNSKNWKKVSGTFGGMLNVMYLNEMEKIRANFNCYATQAQILKQTYAPANQPLFEIFPLKSFDPTTLYVRVDRLNFRFPQAMAQLFEAS